MPLKVAKRWIEIFLHLASLNWSSVILDEKVKRLIIDYIHDIH